ncbi:pre-mRNA 3'-end-processing factor FIP1 [Neoarius graeffei]|uniref:pre-mRNA 3'-end-processing factor FIP1 n=1 Tax=Neoarius graeffei TaxID=443677 RepID=UPI00298BD50E|nr:pre-mRNA 3'-end-processing factor FIP1 [Neoarius graeffei]
MSTGETEKTTGSASGDDEDWLYGDNDDVDEAAGDDDDKRTETEIFSALVGGDVEGGNGVDNQDADSDSESDDNLCITIGNIKTGRIQSTSTPVDLKTSDKTTVSGKKVRGLALVAVDSIVGTPALEVDEELEEKPWRKPGADLSDYFNYGFNEDTWKTYCDKQRKLRMSLQFMTLGSSDKNMGSHDELVSDCSTRRLTSSIDVIGGQTETIVRVEGRRLNSTDGSNTQVQSSSEQPVDAEPPSSKLPAFFAPIVPPPPFPLLSISTAPPFIQRPPRPSMIPSMSVPPPGFPFPPEVLPPPPLTSSSGLSGGSYDGRCAPSYPFAAGVYPHTLGHITPWLGLSDRAKAWKHYSCQDGEREREKDRAWTRDRERDREPKKGQERERDQENTPSVQSRSSDKGHTSRHREHGDRGRERHREHDREREDRHRDRRRRDRTERHKSSRSSSSRRRHSSDDGESHRRHSYKRSKRNKDSTDTESTN